MSFNENDPFANVSTPAVSFKGAPIGTSYTGTVTAPAELVQSRDYNSGQPAFWPDGNPKMSAVIQVEIDGETRGIWAAKPSSMYAAIGAARNALGRAIEPGDEITITHTGVKPSTDPRKEPQKLYEATVRPGRAADPFAGSPARSAPAPARQAPASAGSSDAGGFASTLGASVDPGQLAAAMAALPPEMRARLTGEQSG